MAITKEMPENKGAKKEKVAKVKKVSPYGQLKEKKPQIIAAIDEALSRQDVPEEYQKTAISWWYNSKPKKKHD